MAVGTTLAGILIGSGISAGVSTVNAARQAGAAKDAAKTQAASADQAIDLQRDIFNQRRADMAPYMGAGQSAVTTLAGAMGLPIAPQAPPMTGAAGPVGPQRTRPEGAPVIGHAGPRPDGAAGAQPMRTAMAPQAAQQQSASSFAPGSGGSVRVQAPTGQIVMVPAERVEEAISNGGQVVA